MDEEGIMALPQGAAMQGQQAQQSVTSMQSYDAAQTALGMTDPEGLAALTESIRQNLAGIELSPSELADMIELFEYLSQNPAEYATLRQELIQQDMVDAEDLPEDYDPEFLGAMLIALNELQLSQGQGAMAPMQDTDPMAGMGGMAPMAMAQGGLADVASYLASQGRNGDTMLAHITPEEAQLLRARGGSGTINPATGLPEFFRRAFRGLRKAVKSVGKAVKKVVKSPVGRILATVALATVLGPTAIGMALGKAGTAALVSGGLTLASGGSVKDALVAGAMGYIGGGGTIMGTSPLAAVGKFMPGVAGTALNTGFTTGVLGAGIGKLSGMSTEDALRMGLTSGVSAAAMQGLQNARAGQAAPTTAELAATPDSALASGTSVEAGGAIAPAGTAANLVNPQAPASQMQFAPNDPNQFFDINEMIGFAPAPAAPLPVSVAPVPTSTGFTPNDPSRFFDINEMIGIDPASVSPTSVGPSPTNIQIERGSLGMRGPMDTARQFMSEPINVAKDIYNTSISPSRPGLPADAGMFRKFAPLAAVGAVGAGALGAFDQQPGEENPLFDRAYTGMDYIRDNPDMFRGGLDTSYTRPMTPRSAVVPATFSAAVQPMQQAPVFMGQGISGSPAGVAQPFNMSGLYGVPMIFPVNRAKGGEMTRKEFPRKTGPISGPGTGTSDDIPAMLSDGEFVFTAKAVRNAGKGSRRKGAARMYKLMKMLEGGPVKGK